MTEAEPHLVEAFESWLEDAEGLLHVVLSLDRSSSESVHIARMAHPASHLLHFRNGDAYLSEDTIERLGGVTACLLGYRLVALVRDLSLWDDFWEAIPGEPTRSGVQRTAAVLVGDTVKEQDIASVYVRWVEGLDARGRRWLARELVALVAEGLDRHQRWDRIDAEARRWDWDGDFSSK